MQFLLCHLGLGPEVSSQSSYTAKAFEDTIDKVNLCQISSIKSFVISNIKRKLNNIKLRLNTRNFSEKLCFCGYKDVEEMVIECKSYKLGVQLYHINNF